MDSGRGAHQKSPDISTHPKKCTTWRANITHKRQSRIRQSHIRQAHVRQSWPDSGRGAQTKVFQAPVVGHFDAPQEV